MDNGLLQGMLGVSAVCLIVAIVFTFSDITAIKEAASGSVRSAPPAAAPAPVEEAAPPEEAPAEEGAPAE